MYEIRQMRRVGKPQPRKDDGAMVVAVFDAIVGDLLLTGCQVVRRVDGGLIVSLPAFVRRSRDITRAACFVDRERFLDFRELAIEAFIKAPGGRLDDGLRKMLGAAEAESLAEAGL